MPIRATLELPATPGQYTFENMVSVTELRERPLTVADPRVRPLHSLFGQIDGIDERLRRIPFTGQVVCNASIEDVLQGEVILYTQ